MSRLGPSLVDRGSLPAAPAPVAILLPHRSRARIDVRAAIEDAAGEPTQAAGVMIEMLEADRRRIARDLHDTVGQALVAVRLAVDHAIRKGDQDGAALFSDSLAAIDSAIAEVRGVALNLRPPFLDDAGLVPALRWLVTRHARASGMAAHIHVDPGLPRPTADVEVACFRIAQEALTNVLKHSDACRVTVDLAWIGTDLVLTVADNGRGLPSATTLRRRRATNLGLGGMRDRAAAAGGTLAITSTSGVGTTITAAFPLVAAAAAEVV